MSDFQGTDNPIIGLIDLPEEVLTLVAEQLYPTDVISLRQVSVLSPSM